MNIRIRKSAVKDLKKVTPRQKQKIHQKILELKIFRRFPMKRKLQIRNTESFTNLTTPPKWQQSIRLKGIISNQYNRILNRGFSPVNRN